MESLFRQLRDDLNQIRYACTLNNEESYTASEMQDTYLECLKISSTNYDATAPPVLATQPRGGGRRRRMRQRSGTHAARVETIRKRLSGEGESISIFAAVFQRASVRFDDTLKSWAKDCDHAIGKGSKSVLVDFNRRFEVPAVKSEENQEAVERLKQAAHKALDIIEGPMKEHLERCKAYEKAGC